VRVLHVPSRFQYADIFTKGLPSALFDEFRDSLSVRCTPAPTVGETLYHPTTMMAAFGGRGVWWWVSMLMGLQSWMSSLVEEVGGVVVELMGMK
ncbi:hypothetical protein Tco_1171045, partial [Tanacetum coccineum]